MIAAELGSDFTAVLVADPALSGLGVTIVDTEDDSIVFPRQTSGIVENPAGTYTVILPAPVAPGSSYLVVWDNGGGITPVTEGLTVYVLAPKTARAGTPTEVTLDGAPTGLLGQITVTLTNPDTQAVLSTALTVREFPAGVYQAAFTAPLLARTYRVKWSLPSNVFPEPLTSEQLLVTAPFVPTVTEVAALMRARTKVTGGKELGTFTDQTRPTMGEAQFLIDEAASEILGKIQPPTADTPYERRVRSTIALYAAILIELSYWPEQAKSNQSPVAIWQQMYDGKIRALITEGETGHPGGMGEGTGGAGDAPADAAYTFPEDSGGLVGWQTRW